MTSGWGKKSPFRCSLPSCRLPQGMASSPPPAQGHCSASQLPARHWIGALFKRARWCLCQCSPCCHSSVPKHLLFVVPTQGAAPTPPAPPQLAFNCRSYLGPFSLAKKENEITTLLLPALLNRRTFQGVSVIKGPLISTPALGTTIPPGLGATVFAQWAVLSLWS